MNLLGECYDLGYGVKKDEKKAAELYRSAHELGYAPATCSLALCYEMGAGVEQDKVQAAKLYRQAAEQGDARAVLPGVLLLPRRGREAGPGAGGGVVRQVGPPGLCQGAVLAGGVPGARLWSAP